MIQSSRAAGSSKPSFQVSAAGGLIAGGVFGPRPVARHQYPSVSEHVTNPAPFARRRRGFSRALGGGLSAYAWPLGIDEEGDPPHFEGGLNCRNGGWFYALPALEATDGLCGNAGSVAQFAELPANPRPSGSAQVRCEAVLWSFAACASRLGHAALNLQHGSPQVSRSGKRTRFGIGRQAVSALEQIARQASGNQVPQIVAPAVCAGHDVVNMDSVDAAAVMAHATMRAEYRAASVLADGHGGSPRRFGLLGFEAAKDQLDHRVVPMVQPAVMTKVSNLLGDGLRNLQRRALDRFGRGLLWSAHNAQDIHPSFSRQAAQTIVLAFRIHETYHIQEMNKTQGISP